MTSPENGPNNPEMRISSLDPLEHLALAHREILYAVYEEDETQRSSLLRFAIDDLEAYIVLSHGKDPEAVQKLAELLRSQEDLSEQHDLAHALEQELESEQ